MRIAALSPIVLAPWMLHAQDAPRIQFQGPPPSTAGTRATNGAVRVSGGVMAGMLVKLVMPTTPACSPSGVVVMHAIVGTDGKVERLKLISGPSDVGFITAVMDAVRQWEYKPYLLNGHPVKVDTTITNVVDTNRENCPPNMP